MKVLLLLLFQVSAGLWAADCGDLAPITDKDINQANPFIENIATYQETIEKIVKTLDPGPGVVSEIKERLADLSTLDNFFEVSLLVDRVFPIENRGILYKVSSELLTTYERLFPQQREVAIILKLLFIKDWHIEDLSSSYVEEYLALMTELSHLKLDDKAKELYKRVQKAFPFEQVLFSEGQYIKFRELYLAVTGEEFDEKIMLMADHVKYHGVLSGRLKLGQMTIDPLVLQTRGGPKLIYDFMDKSSKKNLTSIRETFQERYSLTNPEANSVVVFDVAATNKNLKAGSVTQNMHMSNSFIEHFGENAVNWNFSRIDNGGELMDIIKTQNRSKTLADFGISSDETLDVAIVGGGLAGIFTGIVLSQQGMTNFLIFEKSNYVGVYDHVKNYKFNAIPMVRSFKKEVKDPFLIKMMEDLFPNAKVNPRTTGVFPFERFGQVLESLINKYNLPFLFQTEVTNIVPEGEIYRVMTTRGTFLAKQIVFTRGLGGKKFARGDNGVHSDIDVVRDVSLISETTYSEKKPLCIIGKLQGYQMLVDQEFIKNLRDQDKLVVISPDSGGRVEDIIQKKDHFELVKNGGESQICQKVIDAAGYAPYPEMEGLEGRGVSPNVFHLEGSEKASFIAGLLPKIKILGRILVDH